MGPGSLPGSRQRQPGGSLVCGPPGTHLFQGLQASQQEQGHRWRWGQEPQERQRERAPRGAGCFPHSGLASSGPLLPGWLSATLSASSSERAGPGRSALGSPVWLQQKPGKHGRMRCRLGLPWWQSGQHLPAGAGDTGSILGLGRSHVIAEQLSPGATNTEPVLCNETARQ